MALTVSQEIGENINVKDVIIIFFEEIFILSDTSVQLLIANILWILPHFSLG